MSKNHITEMGEKYNIFGDIGSNSAVIRYDFSKANLNEQNRLFAITQVASICYQSPKALGSESLYNRLMAESGGLPSSSFEFVPVLLDPSKQEAKYLLDDPRSNARKFGEWITITNEKDDSKKDYLLTNYRALVYDYEDIIKRDIGLYSDEDSQEHFHKFIKERYLCFFNTEEECEIIKDHFMVFLFNVDLPTRAQMVRHRVMWQELSRRYVSGKRNMFHFYISDKLNKVVSEFTLPDKTVIKLTSEDIIDITLGHYLQALEDGLKPEEARRIITQCMMTKIWGAFMPKQLANFYKMRDDSHAQNEIRLVARAMKELTC